MEKTDKTRTNAAALRRRAEKRLKETKRGSSGTGVAPLSAEEAIRLFHELQVHQIELEMQNEELQRARAEVEASLALYTDLYDFAPVGYFTLGRDGTIRRANLTGARLLGMERGRLVGRRLGLFLSEADRTTLTAFLQKVFASREKETCELAFHRGEKSAPSPERFDKRHPGEAGKVVLKVEAIASADGQDCRAMMTDITERKWAEEELRHSHDQLRALAIRLQEVREETRTAISHDLHDEVGANLAGLKMDLMKLEAIISKVRDAEQRNALMGLSHRAKELINKTILSARRIMMEQRPSVLDDFGLAAAVEWQAGEFRTHTGISCQLITDQQEVDLEKYATTTVFRIFQETLANVARHSGATEVLVRLSSNKEMLVLEVTDNGRGITEEQLSRKDSSGITGMKERALVLGGSIQVRGESGKGTTVKLRVPIGPTFSGSSGRRDQEGLKT